MGIEGEKIAESDIESQKAVLQELVDLDIESEFARERKYSEISFNKRAGARLDGAQDHFRTLSERMRDLKMKLQGFGMDEKDIEEKVKIEKDNILHGKNEKLDKRINDPKILRLLKELLAYGGKYNFASKKERKEDIEISNLGVQIHNLKHLVYRQELPTSEEIEAIEKQKEPHEKKRKDAREEVDTYQFAIEQIEKELQQHGLSKSEISWLPSVARGEYELLFKYAAHDKAREKAATELKQTTDLDAEEIQKIASIMQEGGFSYLNLKQKKFETEKIITKSKGSKEVE